jgi:threonine dehydrogenase-like Zn-dependent dehydrogenase
VRVPYAEHMLVALPSGVPVSVLASAGDNLPDAWRSVAPYLAEWPGASVLILGGGTRATGLYAAGISTALGAGRVAYLDRDPERLRIAEGYGAEAIQARVPPERLGPFEIVLDASATPAGLRCALRSTAPGGHCTSSGIYFEEQPLPLYEMYLSCVNYHTGPCQARALLPEVLALIIDGRFDPRPVTGEIVDWEDAPAAYGRLRTKTVIVRGAAAPGATGAEQAHEHRRDLQGDSRCPAGSSSQASWTATDSATNGVEACAASRELAGICRYVRCGLHRGRRTDLRSS